MRGNYDGEVSQIEMGQTSPGINADFDYPAYIHNSYGRLYQDRPHNVRLDGYYSTPWKLWVGVRAYFQSGAPISRIGYFSQGFSDVQLVPKGTDGRLPSTWEASLTLGYPLAIGPLTVTAQLDVFNLFNNQIRHFAGRLLVHQATRRLSEVPLRSEPGTEQPRVRQGHQPPAAALGSRSDPRLVLSLSGRRRPRDRGPGGVGRKSDRG